MSVYDAPGIVKSIQTLEFPGSSVGLGSSIVTAVILVAAVAQVQSLAWEFPNATGAAIKKKKSAYTF